MTYDAAKIRQLLSIAGAHASNPAAEYIEEIVGQLRGAETAIAEAISGRSKAESEANSYAAQLETANATIRRLREEKAAPAAAVDEKPRKTRAAAAVPPTPTPPPASVAPTAPKKTRRTKTRSTPAT